MGRLISPDRASRSQMTCVCLHTPEMDPLHVGSFDCSCRWNCRCRCGRLQINLLLGADLVIHRVGRTDHTAALSVGAVSPQPGHGTAILIFWDQFVHAGWILASCHPGVTSVSQRFKNLDKKNRVKGSREQAEGVFTRWCRQWRDLCSSFGRGYVSGSVVALMLEKCRGPLSGCIYKWISLPSNYWLSRRAIFIFAKGLCKLHICPSLPACFFLKENLGIFEVVCSCSPLVDCGYIGIKLTRHGFTSL